MALSATCRSLTASIKTDPGSHQLHTEIPPCICAKDSPFVPRRLGDTVMPDWAPRLPKFLASFTNRASANIAIGEFM